MEEIVGEKKVGILKSMEDEDSWDSIFQKREDVVTKSSLEIAPVNADTKQVDYKAEPIDVFLRTHELQKLGLPERRVKISSYDFHIIGNRGKEGGTLYRALAQAITNEEQDFPVIRQVIVETLMSSWSIYGRILVPAYQGKIKRFTPEEIPSKTEDVQRAYINASLKMNIEGTVVELMAVAQKYGFTYTVIFVEKDILRVMNCQDEATKKKASTKYFFLRSGDEFEDWHWEYLIPIHGKDPQKIKIPSGVYPLDILNSYPFNRGKICFPERGIGSNLFESFPSVLKLEDGGLYGCLKTEETDIFSNLSFLLYGSPNLMIEIFEALRGIRSFPSSMSLSRRKKRVMKFEPGTLSDVQIASKQFDFTYVIYGLDENVNFLKLAETPRGFNKKENSKGDSLSKHFTFLTRIRKQFPLEWCILTDVLDSNFTVRTSSQIIPDAVDTTKSVLTPIQLPYTTKKTGMFGLRYRSLRKGAREGLQELMGYNKPAKLDPAKDIMEIYDDFSEEEDYFADFSDISSNNGTGRRVKKERGSFAKLFWRGFKPSVQVAPTDETLDSFDPEDIVVTYEDA